MIYKLLLLVMLSNNEALALELGYHDSQGECVEAAQVVGREYFTMYLGKTKNVLYMCIPFEEV